MPIELKVNGVRVIIRDGDVAVATSLAEFLRERLHLTGTKVGCNVGGCGACTVSVRYPAAPKAEQPNAITVNACITPVLSLHGCSVTTIEGVGDVQHPHEIQQRVAALHASQCGFCTPGMIMSLHTKVSQNPNATTAELEDVFDGNLCRCTGYRPLLDVAKSFAVDIEDLGDMKARANAADASEHRVATDGNSKLVRSCSLTKIQEARERFPSRNEQPTQGQAKKHVDPAIGDLQAADSAVPLSAYVGSCGISWIAPTSVKELLQARREHPKAWVLSGNSGFLRILQLDRDPEAPSPPTIIWTAAMAELQQVVFSVDTTSKTMSVAIGAAATFSVVADAIRHEIAQSSSKVSSLVCESLTQLESAVRDVGSTQSRNTTTVLGHLLSGTAGDLSPLFAALRCTLVVQNSTTAALREVTFGTPFDLASDDVVVKLELKLKPIAIALSAKAQLRRDNTTGLCSIALCLTVESRNIVDATCAAVGVDGSKLRVLEHVSKALNGCPLKATDDAVGKAAAAMTKELEGAASHPEGRTSYRLAAAKGLLLRLLSSAQVAVSGKAQDPSSLSRLHEAEPNVAEGSTPNSISNGTQAWEETDTNIHRMDHTISDSSRAPVGCPEPNVTAIQQATGEAVFVDDVPTPAGCLFGALVKSTIPKGKILKIDASAALATEGVVGYYDRHDVPGEHNPNPTKEHAFCGEEVSYIGDVIGLIVAKTQLIADRAAKLVQVSYDAATDAIFDIDGAIANNSYFPFGREVVDGDVDGTFSGSSKPTGLDGDDDGETGILEGTMRMGGQEHFYLEPHALLVLPGEHQDIEIVSMTQCVTKTQNTVAETLGIPASKVTVKVKRLGGAFGGKEVRTTYTSATLAVAATKLKRPIRWRIGREEDMRITGGRHPFRADWRVAFSKKNGFVRGLDVKLYANGGCTSSATSDVTTRAIMHITNAYKFPAVRVQGFCCKTNIVSNTAYRGFGAPQAMLVTETVMEAVAEAAKVPIEALQYKMLMKKDELTHYGQRVLHCKLDRMWKQLLETSSFLERQAAVHAFNASNRWRKRGLACVPTLYGINFPVRHLNQGGALVTVYTDGTVQLSHQAVEMGQGINTKCAQIAAQAFGIPLSAIHVADTNSDKVPNTCPTAASMGSDLACMAVLDACEQINERVADVAAKNPDASFAQIAAKAWKARINLAAVGHYKVARGAQYDWAAETKDNSTRGAAFNYHVFGVSASEVEVDVLTGQFWTLRSDLLMDCGDPVNATIDIGQVEGAFVQGMGWLTTEELIFGDGQHPEVAPGVLQNANPHGYKIPGPRDVPVDFRVELLSGAPNPFAVHGSKAVGEPPLFLSASVFFAIKKAIKAARVDAKLGPEGFVQLNAPATAERIRMACGDEFVGKPTGDDHVAGSF